MRSDAFLKTLRMHILYIPVDAMQVLLVNKVYSRGQKRFTFHLRRIVEKHSVPFPLYGQPFLGTLFVRSENSHKYGKKYGRKTENERKVLAKRMSVISSRAAAVSLR